MRHRQEWGCPDVGGMISRCLKLWKAEGRERDGVCRFWIFFFPSLVPWIRRVFSYLLVMRESQPVDTMKVDLRIRVPPRNSTLWRIAVWFPLPRVFEPPSPFSFVFNLILFSTASHHLPALPDLSLICSTISHHPPCRTKS